MSVQYGESGGYLRRGPGRRRRRRRGLHHTWPDPPFLPPLNSLGPSLPSPQQRAIPLLVLPKHPSPLLWPFWVESVHSARNHLYPLLKLSTQLPWQGNHLYPLDWMLKLSTQGTQRFWTHNTWPSNHSTRWTTITSAFKRLAPTPQRSRSNLPSVTARITPGSLDFYPLKCKSLWIDLSQFNTTHIHEENLQRLVPLPHIYNKNKLSLTESVLITTMIIHIM